MTLHKSRSTYSCVATEMENKTTCKNRHLLQISQDLQAGLAYGSVTKLITFGSLEKMRHYSVSEFLIPLLVLFFVCVMTSFTAF